MLGIGIPRTEPKFDSPKCEELVDLLENYASDIGLQLIEIRQAVRRLKGKTSGQKNEARATRKKSMIWKSNKNKLTAHGTTFIIKKTN
jgi:hypothetical protein